MYTMYTCTCTCMYTRAGTKAKQLPSKSRLESSRDFINVALTLIIVIIYNNVHVVIGDVHVHVDYRKPLKVN